MRTACPLARSATACARSGRSRTGSPRSPSRRGPLRRRLEGDEPPRRRRQPRRPSSTSCGWRAGSLKGADVDDLVAESSTGCAAVVLIGADRARIAGSAWPDTRRDVPVVDLDPTDTGTMDRVVDRGRRLARPGDVVLLAPGGRLDGHVRQLRRPRGGLRRGRSRHAGRDEGPGGDDLGSRARPARREDAAADAALRPGWPAFDSPVTTYYLMLGATVALVVFGLVMVLSASTVTSLEADGPARRPTRLLQGQLALRRRSGAVALVVACRLPVGGTGAARRARPSSPRVGAPAARLHAPRRTPSTATATGSASGPMTVQPSEVVKLGLVLVGALVLAASRPCSTTRCTSSCPFVLPVAAVGRRPRAHRGTTSAPRSSSGRSSSPCCSPPGCPAAGSPSRSPASARWPSAMVVISPNRLGRLQRVARP